MSWAPKPLSEILEPSDRHRAGDQDLPVLSITMKHGLVDQADKFKKRVASSDTSNYRIAYKNELVVGFPIDEGVLGFQTKYSAAIVSPAYDIWKLKSQTSCHIPYLERYLRSSQARQLYASRMQGAVARRRSLTKDDFLKLEIPFPPIADQIRISHLLGKVEGLIAQRKQQLQQLDDLLKSVFLEMFGDPIRNEKGWGTAEIEKLCDEVIDCPHSTPIYSDEMTGYYCVRSSDIVDGYLELSKTLHVGRDVYEERIKRYTPQIGDIVYSREGGRLGNAARILRGESVCLGQRIMLFKASEENGVDFLWALLESRSFKNKLQGLVGGGAAPRVNIKDLKKITVIQPPPNIQLQYSVITRQVDKIKSLYQQSQNDLENLYGALSQKAFKGELDLSRVPVILEQEESTEEIETEIATVTETSVNPAIELPTPAKIADLSDAKGRMEVIGFWLDSYLEQLGGMSFVAKDFMERAQQKLWELLEGDSYQLSVTEYDHVKELIFKAIEAGRLTQGYDDDKNLVQITAARG